MSTPGFNGEGSLCTGGESTSRFAGSIRLAARCYPSHPEDGVGHNVGVGSSTSDPTKKGGAPNSSRVVDVTEEFPLLVTKLSPYYDR